MPIIAIFFLTQTLFAQIHVDENGSVGIGTDTPSTITKLKIDSDGINDSNTENKYLHLEYTGASVSKQHKGIYVDMVPSAAHGYAGYFIAGRVGLAAIANITSGSYNYGVVSAGQNGQTNYGTYTYGMSDNQYSNNYGVYARGLGTGSINYGIYALAQDATTNWAGYFNGNVHVLGTITTSSDEKLKDGITDIGNSIENIKKLKPKTYKYIKDKNLKLPTGKHYGLTAQDLEKVYPELVTEITHTTVIDPELEEEVNEGVEKEETKAINYNELITILIQGIQDQQEMIEDLQLRVEELEKK